MASRITLIACILFTILLFSCGKEKGCTDAYALNFNPDAEKEGVCTYPKLKLHLHPKVGTADFSFNQSFNINGIDVKFDVAQFYLTGFEIKAMDVANDYSFEDTYLLVKADQHVYELGEGRRETVKDIGFKLGVAQEDNHKDPSDFTTGHPLSPQSPSMNWSWASGYKFLVLEGSADTDMNGTFETNIEYHIGGDANLKDLLITDLNQLVEEESVQMNVKVDYAKFFDNIDLSTENITHVGDYPDVAAKVINNYSGVFSKM